MTFTHIKKTPKESEKPPMKTLNLQKLLHALIIAEECSLVAASKKLHITQSALTRSIQSLEEDLGLQIFHRKSSGVDLTKEGEVVIARARELLDQAGQLQADVRALSTGTRSVVAFGLDPIIAHQILAEQLKAIIVDSRLMQIQVKIESRSTLFSMLTQGDIDFFVADINDFKPVDVKYIDVELLQTVRGSFFVRRGHPLAEKKSVSLAQIYDFPIITPSNVHENTWEELRWNNIDSTAPQRKQQLVCPDIAILKKITAESDAVFASADTSVAEECRAGTLRRLNHDVANDEDLRSIGLVSLKDGNLCIHSREIMSNLSQRIRTSLNPK